MLHGWIIKTDKVIANYVDANNSINKIKLISLFSRDAIVIHEDKHYKGIDAIKTWRKKINTISHVNLEVVGVSATNEGILTDILCTGDLLESALIVQFEFIISNSLIISLKIN
jgi:hypothetical protein